MHIKRDLRDILTLGCMNLIWILTQTNNCGKKGVGCPIFTQGHRELERALLLPLHQKPKRQLKPGNLKFMTFKIHWRTEG